MNQNLFCHPNEEDKLGCECGRWIKMGWFLCFVLLCLSVLRSLDFGGENWNCLKEENQEKRTVETPTPFFYQITQTENCD